MNCDQGSLLFRKHKAIIKTSPILVRIDKWLKHFCELKWSDTTMPDTQSRDNMTDYAYHKMTSTSEQFPLKKNLCKNLMLRITIPSITFIDRYSTVCFFRVVFFISWLLRSILKCFLNLIIAKSFAVQHIKTHVVSLQLTWKLENNHLTIIPQHYWQESHHLYAPNLSVQYCCQL